MKRVWRWVPFGLAAMLVGQAAGAARPDAPQPVAPIWIESVDAAACFDKAALEAEIRLRLPEVEMGPGAASRGGAQVTVRLRGHELDVELAREPEHGAPRVEHRALPLGSDCRVLVETTASIAVRAVVPLGYRPIEPSPIRRAQLPVVVVTVALPSPSLPPAQLLFLQSRPHPAPQLQLSAALRANVSVDGFAPTAGGLFELAFRRRGFLFFVGAGVDDAVGMADESVVATLRRVPIVAGAGYEVAVPHSAIRFSLAALADLWNGRIDDPRGSLRFWSIQPGMQGSVAWHVRVVRMLDAYAGVDVEYAFTRDTQRSPDGSLVVTTPSVWINPMIGASLNFF